MEDLGSKPIIKVSIGTKIPPPPTPPTLPNDAPKNPISDPNTIFHPNSISYHMYRIHQISCISKKKICRGYSPIKKGLNRIRNTRVYSLVWSLGYMDKLN